MSVEQKRNGCVGVLLWMLIILLAGFVLIGLGAFGKMQQAQRCNDKLTK